jgi:hypothetical protein
VDKGEVRDQTKSGFIRIQSSACFRFLIGRITPGTFNRRKS